jgi:transposase-like protein
MKRRKWSSEQKLKIVLEGLSGQIEIGKLCNKYQISQALYYRWRDQLLSHGHQAFETKNITKKEQHLKDENRHLKQIIGDLTIELKKSEYQ